MRRPRLSSAASPTLAALAAFLLAPAAARAQVGFSVACAPGIPGCAALRFTLTNGGPDLVLDALGLRFLTPGWTFTPGPTPTVGTYAATDSFGPFSSFTTIGAAGTAADIDFTDVGFSFTLLAGGVGFLDLEAAGGPSATGPEVSLTGTTGAGGTVTGTTGGSTVPEPAAVWLVGAGLAGLGLRAAPRASRRRAGAA